MHALATPFLIRCLVFPRASTLHDPRCGQEVLASIVKPASSVRDASRRCGRLLSDFVFR